MNNYLLYFHRNPITNGVFYVGIGDEKRPYSKYGRGIHWQKYTNKYPDYKIEIAEENLSREDAIFMECNYIQMFGRKGYERGGCLVNSTTGGDAAFSFKHTDETKAKISAAGKGRDLGKKRSAETRLKQSLAKMGKKQSADHIAKRLESSKHIWASDEFKQKMSVITKGRKLTPENKAKLLAAAAKAPKVGMRGKHHSNETKEILRKASTGRYLSKESKKKCSDAQKLLQRCAKKVKDTRTGIIYNSISKAAEAEGIQMKTLSWRMHRQTNYKDFIFITIS